MRLTYGIISSYVRDMAYPRFTSTTYSIVWTSETGTFIERFFQLFANDYAL